jgi:energy-coupling factor transport system ATP-binding protein
MSLSIIKTDRIRYTYQRTGGQWILDDINLNIEQGEYILLCGASGSGKSTLCRTFNGLIPHFYGGSLKGEIRVAGLITTQHSVGALFEQVGMVFQNPEAQLFNFTVKREIAFGLESLGLPRAEIETRLAKISELVGISDLLNRNPHEISGGEQQLVSIAAILAIGPKLIVLDEPYANLDPYNVRRIRSLLKKIHREGVGVIISEHRLRYTVPDVQRMVVLHQGRVVLDGPPAEVLTKDVESFGIELPLAVRAGRQLGLKKLPLDVTALQSNVTSSQALPDLRPIPLAPLPNEAETVLKAEEISFVLSGDSILYEVSLTLKQGECLAVVGANGAGKTTLLKLLNGLYRTSGGRVFIKGQDTAQLKVSQLARHVGIAFQNPNNQFFKLSVRDEIIVGAQALECYDEKWIKELTRMFRLEPLLDRSPYRLSGGEKKRVAFAAALAAKPSILAFDEPTAGQDGYFRRALGDFMSELRSRGQAVLLITHDLAFAEQHAHRWLLMSKGRMVAEGPPKQVMADNNVMALAGLEPTDSFRLYE